MGFIEGICIKGRRGIGGIDFDVCTVRCRTTGLQASDMDPLRGGGGSKIR